MKKAVLVLGLLLMGIPLVGADSIPEAPELVVMTQDAAPVAMEAAVMPVPPPVPLALANCYPAYQACRNNCAGNQACLGNCLDLYNACRLY